MNCLIRKHVTEKCETTAVAGLFCGSKSFGKLSITFNSYSERTKNFMQWEAEETCHTDVWARDGRPQRMPFSAILDMFSVENV